MQDASPTDPRHAFHGKPHGLEPWPLAWRVLAATVAVSVVLAGCGGGHEGKRPAGSAQRTTSATSGRAGSPMPTATKTTSLAAAEAYWPYNKLVGKLAGRTLTLPHGPVRLDRTLLECAGEGAPRKSGTTRRWSHYTCTQTLFRGGVDRDVTFDVAILNATQLRISSQRYGAE
jgi:hypothetical protein